MPSCHPKYTSIVISEDMISIMSRAGYDFTSAISFSKLLSSDKYVLCVGFYHSLIIDEEKYGITYIPFDKAAS